MRRGFTLVELMVVMAITGIIASQLVGMLGDARDEAWRRATPAQWAARAHTAFTLMRRDVRGAQQTTVLSDLEVDGTRWQVVDGQLRRGAEVIAAPVKAATWRTEGRAIVVTLDFEAAQGTQRATARHVSRIALREDQR